MDNQGGGRRGGGRGERPGGWTNQRRDEGATHRPFAKELKGMRAGPACLRCSEPVDTREGWSLDNPRGNRRPQRHGYLHPRCEEEANLELARAQGLVREEKERDGSVVQRVLPGVRLELPVYTETELDGMLHARERQ